MTPKEKADELVEKFKKHIPHWDYYSDTDDSKRQLERAKQCALIAVDEIIKSCPIKLVGSAGKFTYTDDYWNEVKSEIEKL